MQADEWEIEVRKTTNNIYDAGLTFFPFPFQFSRLYRPYARISGIFICWRSDFIGSTLWKELSILLFSYLYVERIWRLSIDGLNEPERVWTEPKEYFLL